MEKKNVISEILRNIKSNYLRMIILGILTFLSSVIFARVLGPDTYGIYTYLTWLISTIAILFGLGLPGTITKFLPMYYFNEQYDQSKKFLKNLLFIQSTSILVVSCTMILTIPLWQGLINNTSSENLHLLLLLAAINIVPTTILSLFISSVQALQRFDLYSKVAIQANVVGFLINLLIVFLIPKVEYLLIASLLVTIYQVLTYSTVLKKSIPLHKNTVLESNADHEHIDGPINGKRIFNYSKYMYMNVVWQQIVFARSEYFFLGIYSTPKEIAMYGIAYSLVSMSGMVFTPIMNVLNNFFSGLVARKDFELLETIVVNLTKYFIILLMFILTCAAAISEKLIIFVYSNEYSSVYISFFIMFSGFVILQGISVAGSIPFLYEKQKFIVNIGLVAGVINIIQDLVLIPMLGSIGAAIANATTQVICSVIGFIYTIKITRFRFNLARLIPCILLSTIFCSLILLVRSPIIKLTLLVLYIASYFAIILFTKILKMDEMKKLLATVR
ncbi:oligosaccharide flippase family protein [Cohnella caldifontis]|uniref:oligosaccharide flippase family protein n=1 Tax=Cohnella caldifontis TaxID=3027471 RepID=UPI0023ED2034|nr:oligosaccharide flippase family protein [Cohnella sp. YIM B05605]